MVPGKGKTCQYLHVNYEDCQAELAGPSELSEALHADRLRQRGGVSPKIPGLGQMEEW